MKRTKLIAAILAVLLAGGWFLRGCTETPPPPKPSDPKVENPPVQVPVFDEKRAYQSIERQVAFGPRVPNTLAHTQCATWLEEQFKSYGATVTLQNAQVNAWDGTPLKIRNIIASFKPEAGKRLLLAAHWDTRPYADKDPDSALHKKPIDGANDGASGVAVLLEMARLFSEQQPTVGIDIILFDAEDYGTPEWAPEGEEDMLTWCLGSQYWRDNPHKAGYQAMYGILLDMVGGKDARFNREGVSIQVAPDVVNRIWSTAEKLGYGNYFQDTPTSEIVDDHIFMNQAGVRSIDIVDMRPATKTMGFGGYQFGDFHHTHKDNLEQIDPATLKAVGQTLAQVVYTTK